MLPTPGKIFLPVRWKTVPEDLRITKSWQQCLHQSRSEIYSNNAKLQIPSELYFCYLAEISTGWQYSAKQCQSCVFFCIGEEAAWAAGPRLGQTSFRFPPFRTPSIHPPFTLHILKNMYSMYFYNVNNLFCTVIAKTPFHSYNFIRWVFALLILGLTTDLFRNN